MKLKQLQEAKHIQHGSFDSLMLNYFTKHKDDDFLWMWIPKPDSFPWLIEDGYEDWEVSYIGQGDPNEIGISENDVWIEYVDDIRGGNGDWMPKEHAVKHLLIRDELGKKVYP